MSDPNLSRRALFTLGLSRLRRELPDEDSLSPRRERPPADADDRLIAAIEEADLHRLSEAPARALLELAPPPPGEDVLVVAAEQLDDALAGLTESLLAVADAGEVGDLPFDDGDFGVVLAPYAASFWPATNIAVAELFRVLRPGGTLAVASWTGEGAVGRLLSAASDWDPALPPTLTWASEGQVRTPAGAARRRDHLLQLRRGVRVPLGPGRRGRAGARAAAGRRGPGRLPRRRRQRPARPRRAPGRGGGRPVGPRPRAARRGTEKAVSYPGSPACRR